MNTDKTLIDLVNVMDKEIEYFSITYVCISGGTRDLLVATNVGMIIGGSMGMGMSGALGALSNDFGVMIANEEELRIHVMNKFAVSIEEKNVVGTITIPYNILTKLKIKRFLIWYTVKLYVYDGRRTAKLKLVISSKTVGIKRQKENVNELIKFLKKFKNNKIDN